MMNHQIPYKPHNRCSGDVVRRERDGGLYWEGRVDGVVKRMGKRIQLGSVDLVSV